MAEYPPLLPRGEHEEFESSRDLPQKNRRAFNKNSQDTDENLIQVETKPGSTWTEPEQEVRKPRVKQDTSLVIDAGPSVQVETKVPPTEADIGAELIKTMFTVAKRGTDATIESVQPAQPENLDFSFTFAPPAESEATVPQSVDVPVSEAEQALASQAESAVQQAKRRLPQRAIDKAIQEEKEEQASVAGNEAVAQPEGVQSGLEEFAGEVKDMFSEKLGEEAEVAELIITKTPEGMRVHAELHQGMAGKISLDGMLVANGNTFGIEGLNVKADRFEKTVRKKIEENLSDLGTALQSHFEKRYGKPISGIRAGESGFAVDFKAPEETGPEQEAKLEVFQSNRKNIGGAEVVSESQFTPMQMAEID